LFEFLIKNNGFTTRWNTLLDPKITSSTNQIKWNRKKIEITREGGGNTAEVKHDKYPQLCSRRLDFDSLICGQTKGSRNGQIETLKPFLCDCGRLPLEYILNFWWWCSVEYFGKCWV
jgi:hypothetical protein